MLPHPFIRRLIAAVALLGALSIASPRARADDAADSDAQVNAKRKHWESVVYGYIDKDTGGWSLRIDDANVTERSKFEWREIWQFNPKDKAWHSIYTPKFTKSIALPKDKSDDEPQTSQVLVNVEEIPAATPGLWYAKWRIDDIPGGTMLRVGPKQLAKEGVQPPSAPGVISVSVPTSMDKSEAMIVPDPRIYCVKGGPGKPTTKP